MSKHNETGAKGEQIAEKFLLDKGYAILHRNWRFEKREIDLIAQRNDMLVFTEVKTRSRTDFGYPEEAVNLRKQTLMKEAATAYMEANPLFTKVQFDVISICMVRDQVKEIVHFEDAFF